MKRIRLFIYFLFVVTLVKAQDYERVDATILLYPQRFELPEELAAMIARDFSSEDEQVRALYSWLIENVAYDPEEYNRFDYNFKNYRERNQKDEKLRDQIIRRTLKTGVAVCEGYAMLFEKVCEQLGINNYLVRGDIKTNFQDIGRPFKRIHMWNVAQIDGTYYLFDATWGAGKYRGKFIKEPNYYYFKTPPEFFVKTHFPDMEEDTLLSEMIGRNVFASWPLVIDEDLRIDDLVSPFVGVINSIELMGEIPISLHYNREVAVSYSFGNEKREVDASLTDGLLNFSIPIQLGEQQLLIYFDEKPALAYLIK